MFLLPDHDQEDFNRLPSRREMSSHGLYWNWVGSILQGVGGHAERENQRIAALRRNAEHYDRQRRPSVVAEIIAEAVDVVASLPVVMKAATARERAGAWLREQLATGPLAAPEVERRVRDSGLALKTVRRAGKAMGVKPQRRKAAWWWSLPAQDGQGREGS